MALGSPTVSLGEYLVTLGIIGVVLFGLVGFLFGTGFGGVLIFIIAGVLAVIISYAVLARVWMFLLHGSFGGGGGDSSGNSGGNKPW